VGVGVLVEPELKTPLAHWPGLRTTDLGIRDPGGDRFRALAELKWARENSTIAETLWDLAKMSLARAENIAETAFVIAGARDSMWKSGLQCSPLFDGGEWSTFDLIGLYPKAWIYDVKAYPVRLWSDSPPPSPQLPCRTCPCMYPRRLADSVSPCRG
jgi:hypothetical protein